MEITDDILNYIFIQKMNQIYLQLLRNKSALVEGTACEEIISENHADMDPRCKYAAVSLNELI